METGPLFTSAEAHRTAESAEGPRVEARWSRSTNASNTASQAVSFSHRVATNGSRPVNRAVARTGWRPCRPSSPASQTVSLSHGVATNGSSPRQPSGSSYWLAALPPLLGHSQMVVASRTSANTTVAVGDVVAAFPGSACQRTEIFPFTSSNTGQGQSPPCAHW